ncbi:MAG: peroxidase family protein [Cyanobacteria bacterium P01_G01_bin.4]
MTVPWHRLPTPCALLKLLGFRIQLREKNLHDTSQLSRKEQHPQASDKQHLNARTDDGSYNSLEQPSMGMAGTRFGRNIALKDIKAETESQLLSPNPRLVSRRLMTRDSFRPATILNVLAAAWIQFENHDWFSHGENLPDEEFEVEVEADDDWPQDRRPIKVKKSRGDDTRTDGGNPPTFINDVTHWWDGSQVYGSSRKRVAQIRTHVDGKVVIGEDGLLPIEPSTGVDFTGFSDNWWVGLSLLHTLFVKEHNTICDRLKQRYPDWSDDDLFDLARLINAALMAKIHTVEWTPAILPLKATDIALNVNWAGFLGEDFRHRFGRIGSGDLLSGIPGSNTDHHAAPYAITEEFVSVYRMHPLIPDDFHYYSVETGELLLEEDFFQSSGKRTRAIVEAVGMDNLFYSLGIAHPGALTLHNYPKFLQQHQRDNGEFFDLAAVDILRDRERGVPRYNRFRELIGRGRVKEFEEITSNPTWAQELRQVYDNDIDRVDLMVGLFAEDLPQGFGFSDTAFRVFILMASRRLKSDRFFTKDYRAEVYTQFGLDWVYNNTMLTVLKRHYPSLAPSLAGVKNAFAPWKTVGV